MGKLDLAVGYLSGAMEFVADHGIGWRREFSEKLHKVCPKIDLIDPTDKPGGEEIKIGENKEYQQKLKDDGNFLELHEYVKQYRRYDLRFVDYSDFVIVAIDPNSVPQWGTANEAYMAEMLHRPIFFLCEGGPSKLPNWLFALLKFNGDTPTNIFEDIDSLVEILKSLDSGEESLSREWVLIRKWIESNRQQRLEIINRQRV